MNAIDLLETQHRDVANLFDKILTAGDDTEEKEQLFIDLADSLAIHASIEEHHFYPAVKEKHAKGKIKDILLESLEEHLAIKRVLSDLLDLDIEDETFDAKMQVLKEEVEHHVKEEEEELFPKVKRVFDEGELEALGQAMSAEQEELEEKGNPRDAVPDEIDRAAHI